MAATTSAQIVVVSHLTCAPGQQIAVRVLNVQASERVGLYGLVVHAFDDNGSSATVAVARVQSPPSTRLHVTAPSIISTGQQFIVQVSAIDRFGRVDHNYRGSVAINTRPFDCSQQPDASVIAHVFTAADRGTADIPMAFSGLLTRQLYVYDVAHAAQPALSNTFAVILGVPYITCPVHYD